MAGTGGSSGEVDLDAPVPLPVTDGGGSLTVDGTVAVTDGGGSLTVDGSVSVSNFPATQPVSAVSLPLPTGAATLAAQRDDEWISLCDTVTTFLRRFRTDSTGTVTAADFTLDGTTPYVTVGAVTKCSDVTIPTPVPVTDNGGSLTVDGSVSVSNLPAVQPVSDNGGSLTVDGSVSVSNFPATQPVSAAALPLPAGAATSALQTTGNSSLATIAGSNSTLTMSTVNLGSGSVNVGSGSKGWTAVLVVSTAVTPGVGDTGTIGGQTVPVGYSFAVDAAPGRTIANNTALTAAGVARWIVGVRT